MGLVIEAADWTQSSSNVSSTSLSVSHAAYADGDLVLVLLTYWQDNNNTTDVTAPSGPNGETITVIDSNYGHGTINSDTNNMFLGWFIGNGAASAGSMTFTSNDATRFNAGTCVVPSGEFDPTTPISGNYGQDVGSGTTQTIPGFTTASDDAGGKIIAWLSIDQDPLSGGPATGYTSFINDDAGRVSHAISGRDTEASNSESVSSIAPYSANDHWTAWHFLVRANNQVVAPGTGSLSFTGQTPTIDVTSGGTDVTRTPDTGSLSLAGLAPTLRLDIAPADTPSVSLTGQAPTLRLDIAPADTPALTLTGQEPTAGESHFIDVPAGSLSITGLEPSAEETHIRQVPIGELTILGLEPQANEASIRDPPAGTLELTGLAPSAEEDHIRATDAGSLTLTGLEPSAGADLVATPDPGQLSLTGLAPSAEEDHAAEMPAGSGSLTGLQAGLDLAIGVPAGSLSVAGETPAAGESYTITPDTGALSLAGLAPTLTDAGAVAPDQGELSLTGLVPGFDMAIAPADTPGINLTGLVPGFDMAIAPADTPAYSFTGLAPTLDIGGGTNTSIEVPKTELNLTTFVGLFLNGQAPTVSVTEGIPEGTLALTGQAPETIAPLELEVPAGSLTLTGYAVVRSTLQLQGLTPAVEIVINNADSSLVLIPYAPEVSQDESPPSIVRTPGQDSLAITGLQPERPVGLLLRGLEPTVIGGDVGISADVGILRVSFRTYEEEEEDPEAVDTAPIVQVGAIAVPVGSLSLATYAPSDDFERRPPDGDLAVTGLQPAPLVYSDLRSPDYGQAVLTGQSPTPVFGIAYLELGSVTITLHGLTISIEKIWKDVAGASGSWSDVAPGSGIWTDVSGASTDWSAESSASGIWTDTPGAAGSWSDED